MNNNMKKKSITVLAQSYNLKELMEFVRIQMEADALTLSAEIQLAIEEVFLNIANYAYGDNKGYVTVQISLHREPPILTVTFIDSGVPFNPKETPRPNINLPLQEREIGGLGLFLVDQIMDSITYTYKNNKNILTLFKELN